MTQAISGKNQVSNQAWRRHTDPPGLWLSVVIASVLLHLGGIWLIRFSGVNFALQPDSASVIPIDFVEVAPVKTATKSVVSRKSKSPRPKPRVSSTKQVNRNNFDRRVNPRSNVGDGIALTDNTTKKKVIPKKRSLNTSKPVRKKPVVRKNPFKKQRTQSNQTKRATRQRTPANSNTQARKQQQPPFSSNTRARKQQQPPVNSNTNTRARKQQQPPVNSNIPAKKQQQSPVNSNTPSKNTETNQPWNQSRGNIKLGTDQSRKLAPNPSLTTNQSSPSNSSSQGGVLIIRVNPLSRQAVLAGNFKLNAPPDVMAKYTGNQANTINISIRDKYPGLKAAKLLVSLVIDKNGKFEQASVLSIEPQKLAMNKTQYQNFLDEHFRNQKFIPAVNNNGTKPEVSNLILRIAIETNLPGSMVENK